jgi:hypothetical protein
MEQYTHVQEGTDTFGAQYTPWIRDLPFALDNYNDENLGHFLENGVRLMFSFKMIILPLCSPKSSRRYL